MSEKITEQKGHNLFVYGKNKITLTGVKSVDSFDENLISATLFDESSVYIEGKGLNIVVLDLEKGCIDAESQEVTAVYYTDGTVQKKGFFSRLVKG